MKFVKAAIAGLVLLYASFAPAQPADNGIENLRKTGKAFAAVARDVSPSVVYIEIEKKVSAPATPSFGSPFGEEGPFGDDFFRRFFGDEFPRAPRPRRPETPQPKNRIVGQGSGFVFKTEQGTTNKTYILTNNHVVKQADRIRVQFKDGKEYDARITGRDPHSDVAVIEIAATGLPALTLADSSRLEVGEWVVAIGNPFGLNHTLTVGVVSAKGRTSVGINDYEDFIQTDAAINPGNSGGPLVNLKGEVVGINTAIFSRSGGYMGIGFAIPSNLVSTIAHQLIQNGSVSRGYLGVVIQPLTAELAESFGVKSGKGILVAEVSDASPAHKAGLREGDVIVKLNGDPISEVGHFRNRIALTPPGQTVHLTIQRNGAEKVVPITVGKRTEDTPVTKGGKQRDSEIGVTVQTLTPHLAKQWGISSGEGVVVTEVKPGSVAAMARLSVGTVILQVNKQAVKTAQAFQKAIRNSANRKRATLLVRQGDMQRYIVLSW